MATDLTTQLQEIITSTIETALAKTTHYHNCFKSPAQNLANTSFIKVDTNFSYGEDNLQLRYLINLPLSSMIFHGMMFENYVCEETINDEILDASKEFVSQLSGGLELSINAGEFPDISGVKYTMGDIAIHNEENYDSLGNIFRFVLEIEEKPFDLFIDMNDTNLSFFETLNKSQEDAILEPSVQEMPEEENIQEATDDAMDGGKEDSEEPLPDGLDDVLTKNENQEDEKDEPVEDNNKEDESNDNNDTNSNTPEVANDENAPTDEEINEDEKILTDEEKKKKKLKLIIIILGGIIGLLILTTLVLYFMGVFDQPEIKQEDTNTTKVVQPSNESMIIAEIKNKQIEFTPDLINEERINKKLALLTKYEILEEDIVAKFQQEEKERLYKIKMEKLEEFAKNNKEESLFKNKENLEQNSSIDTNSVVDEKYLEEKLTFIKVDPLEYKNFQAIINGEKTQTTQVSMCKDSIGKIDIYIGPMYLNLETNNIIKAVRKKYPQLKEHINLINMSRRDFNSLCNF